VDVFAAASGASGDALVGAAIEAAHALGVHAALPAANVAALAAAIGARGVARLGALVDVLAAVGAVVRGADGSIVASAGAMPARAATPIAGEGWGRLAEVIRADQPLAVDEDPAALARLHDHLATAGAAAAAELAPLLAPGPLVDLGGGAGAYTAAVLARDPDATAVIVDAPEVLALARARLAAFDARVGFVAGDARDAAVGDRFGAALLANVLHFHPRAACAALVGAAARAVVPGGVVVIKDLRVDDGRAGPLAGLLFALGMKLYTEAGDVYATGELRALLGEAGLVDVDVRALAAAPDAVVVVGRRPQ
jgi:SAM-dependent methyltransferase